MEITKIVSMALTVMSLVWLSETTSTKKKEADVKDTNKQTEAGKYSNVSN